MRGMDDFKMLLTAINSGELANKMCKTSKFGFVKSVDLFSNTEFLNKV